MGEENKKIGSCSWVKSTQQFMSINVKTVWQIVLFLLFSSMNLTENDTRIGNSQILISSRDEKAYYREKLTREV